MTVYIDLVLLLNYFFDVLLLLSVSVILKRHVKFRRILIGAFVGSATILSLFINVNSILLFILKIMLGFLMLLSTFGFKSLKYTIQNGIYLYMISTVLGGFLYYLNVEFSYTQDGLTFIYTGMNINYLFLLVLSPIALYLFIKCQKKLRTNYDYYYNIKLVFKNKELNLNAYLDTGNKLKDPITNKGIILVSKKCLKDINIRSPIYVPYNSLNNHGLLQCIKPDFVEIMGIKSKKYLIGISDESFKLDGIDCILNAKCLEEI